MKAYKNKILIQNTVTYAMVIACYVLIQALMAAGLILIGIFAADQIYSSIHPNEGEGITSYEAFPASREVEPW